MSYEPCVDGDYDLGNCHECGGTGYVTDERTEEDVDCPECGGSGWVGEGFDDDMPWNG